MADLRPTILRRRSDRWGAIQAIAGILLGLWACTLGACNLAPASRAAAAVWFPGEGADLPVHRVGDYLLVDARIDGNGPFPLLLDTGADFLTLDTAIADQVSGLGPPAVRRIRGATGATAAVDLGATIDEVVLGNLHLRGVPAIFRDFSEIRDTLGVPIAGLLGMGVFDHGTLELDYPRNEVRFHHRPLAAAETGGAILPMGSGVLPEVDVAIGPDRRIRCLIDSGCGWAMAIPGALDEELLLPDTRQLRLSVSIVGLHERIEGTLRHPVRLGPHVLAPVAAVAGSGRPKVGAPLLQNFHLVLDFAHRRAGWFAPQWDRADKGR